MRWHYDSPPAKFWEGLPIGTGRFVAMVHGSAERELLTFNDETLWTGGPHTTAVAGAPAGFKKVRELALARDFVAADALARKLFGKPLDVQLYQPMARLVIRSLDGTGNAVPAGKVKNYTRELDMDDALATVRYELDGVRYTRRFFASFPDQVIVCHISADKPGAVSLATAFETLQPDSASRIVDGDTVVMSGRTIERADAGKRLATGSDADRRAGRTGLRTLRVPSQVLPSKMRWQSRVKVLRDGGTLERSDAGGRSALIVKNANSVTLILAGATNWKAWNDVTGDAERTCADYIRAALLQSPRSPLPAPRSLYQALLDRHLADYRPLFSAFKIYLGPEEFPQRTTTQTMDALRTNSVRASRTAGSSQDKYYNDTGDARRLSRDAAALKSLEGAFFDPAYETRYMQYGRYLLLCGSREGTLVFNNHNPWLDNLEGRWQGRWTLNFNLQVELFALECTGLQRLNDSLLIFTEQLAESGKHTAREHFGYGGWCATHGTDVWMHTAPTGGQTFWGMWPLGGAWLLQQLYEHYRFDPDDAYLRRLYPLLKGATEFCADLLIKDPVTGYMVTCPSTSPENSFRDASGKGGWIGLSFASAADTQILRRLFADYLEAATTLKRDPEFRARIEKLEAQLPPHRIGKRGALQEWFYDFKEAEPTHRHVMHLYALYPDDAITARRTPALAEAARKTLRLRGDFRFLGLFGIWKVHMYARLLDGERAYALFRKMITEISCHPYPEDSSVTPSMEGNQGVQAFASGALELLVQSHGGELALLPALPKQWATEGAVSGVRARGGITLSMAWKNGSLTRANLQTKHAGKLRLRVGGSEKIKITDTKTGTEIPTKSTADGTLEFPIAAGGEYSVLPL
jgi:alpha-L-fucosidase 2